MKRTTNKPNSAKMSAKMGNNQRLRIFLGDNLKILRAVDSETVRLIYIDPPFNTGKKQERVSIRTVEDSQGDRIGFGGKRYKTENGNKSGYADSYGNEYLEFLGPRLREAHRILAADGSLFFHIDYRESHYCKILLDQIFGRESFMNEIIWAYDFGGRSKSRWSPKHDNIFWYAKNPNNYVFHHSQIERVPYMAPSLVGAEKAIKGKTPTDVWWHTIVPTASREKTGYATQKPVGLLEKIVKVHSDPGDMLMDFFAGSGSFGVAAIKNERRCILIDKNPQAKKIMENRLAMYSPASEPFSVKPSGKSKDVIDPEVKILADHASSLASGYKLDPIWQNSLFNCIKNPIASSQIGKIGKDLVKEWLRRQKFLVSSTEKGDREADILVNNKRIEIKFSTLWEGRVYEFQQIRDQHYDAIVCLGISPSDAHSWVFSKNFFMRNKGKGEFFVPQHKGSAGIDTYWIRINPRAPPNWLKDKGGSLSAAIEALRKLLPPS